MPEFTYAPITPGAPTGGSGSRRPRSRPASEVLRRGGGSSSLEFDESDTQAQFGSTQAANALERVRTGAYRALTNPNLSDRDREALEEIYLHGQDEPWYSPIIKYVVRPVDQLAQTVRLGVYEAVDNIVLGNKTDVGIDDFWAVLTGNEKYLRDQFYNGTRLKDGPGSQGRFFGVTPEGRVQGFTGLIQGPGDQNRRDRSNDDNFRTFDAPYRVADSVPLVGDILKIFPAVAEGVAETALDVLGGRLDEHPVGLIGGALDIVADPLNLIGMGATLGRAGVAALGRSAIRSGADDAARALRQVPDAFKYALVDSKVRWVLPAEDVATRASNILTEEFPRRFVTAERIENLRSAAAGRIQTVVDEFQLLSPTGNAADFIDFDEVLNAVLEGRDLIRGVVAGAADEATRTSAQVIERNRRTLLERALVDGAEGDIGPIYNRVLDKDFAALPEDFLSYSGSFPALRGGIRFGNIFGGQLGKSWVPTFVVPHTTGVGRTIRRNTLDRARTAADQIPSELVQTVIGYYDSIRSGFLNRINSRIPYFNLGRLSTRGAFAAFQLEDSVVRGLLRVGIDPADVSLAKSVNLFDQTLKREIGTVRSVADGKLSEAAVVERQMFTEVERLSRAVKEAPYERKQRIMEDYRFQHPNQKVADAGTEVVQAVTSTLFMYENAVRRVFGIDGIDGYIPQVASKEARRLIDKIAEEGIVIDPERGLGHELLAYMVSARNHTERMGNVSFVDSPHLRERSLGRNVVSFGNDALLIKPEGFPSIKNLNEELTSAMREVVSSNRKLRSSVRKVDNPNFRVLEERPNRVITQYMESMNQALGRHALIADGFALKLIRPEMKAVNKAATLVALARNKPWLLEALADASAAARTDYHDALAAVESTFDAVTRVELGGGMTVDVPTYALGNRRVQQAVERFRRLVTEDPQRWQRQYNEQVNALVRQGIPREMAETLAVSDVADFRLVRQAFEHAAHEAIAELEEAFLHFVALAPADVKPRLQAQAGRIRRRANRVKRQAEEVRATIHQQWEDELRTSERVTLIPVERTREEILALGNFIADDILRRYVETVEVVVSSIMENKMWRVNHMMVPKEIIDPSTGEVIRTVRADAETGVEIRIPSAERVELTQMWDLLDGMLSHLRQVLGLDPDAPVERLTLQTVRDSIAAGNNVDFDLLEETLAEIGPIANRIADLGQDILTDNKAYAVQHKERLLDEYAEVLGIPRDELDLQYPGLSRREPHSLFLEHDEQYALGEGYVGSFWDQDEWFVLHAQYMRKVLGDEDWEMVVRRDIGLHPDTPIEEWHEFLSAANDFNMSRSAMANAWWARSKGARDEANALRRANERKFFQGIRELRAAGDNERAQRLAMQKIMEDQDWVTSTLHRLGLPETQRFVVAAAPSGTPGGIRLAAYVEELQPQKVVDTSIPTLDETVEVLTDAGYSIDEMVLTADGGFILFGDGVWYHGTQEMNLEDGRRLLPENPHRFEGSEYNTFLGVHFTQSIEVALAAPSGGGAQGGKRIHAQIEMSNPRFYDPQHPWGITPSTLGYNRKGYGEYFMEVDALAADPGNLRVAAQSLLDDNPQGVLLSQSPSIGLAELVDVASRRYVQRLEQAVPLSDVRGAALLQSDERVLPDVVAALIDEVETRLSRIPTLEGRNRELRIIFGGATIRPFDARTILREIMMVPEEQILTAGADAGELVMRILIDADDPTWQLWRRNAQRAVDHLPADEANGDHYLYDLVVRPYDQAMNTMEKLVAWAYGPDTNLTKAALAKSHIEALRAEGFDGIVYRNTIEGRINERRLQRPVSEEEFSGLTEDMIRRQLDTGIQGDLSMIVIDHPNQVKYLVDPADLPSFSEAGQRVRALIQGGKAPKANEIMQAFIDVENVYREAVKRLARARVLGQNAKGLADVMVAVEGVQQLKAAIDAEDVTAMRAVLYSEPKVTKAGNVRYDLSPTGRVIRKTLAPAQWDRLVYAVDAFAAAEAGVSRRMLHRNQRMLTLNGWYSDAVQTADRIADLSANINASKQEAAINSANKVYSDQLELLGQLRDLLGAINTHGALQRIDGDVGFRPAAEYLQTVYDDLPTDFETLVKMANRVARQAGLDPNRIDEILTLQKVGVPLQEGFVTPASVGIGDDILTGMVLEQNYAMILQNALRTYGSLFTPLGLKVLKATTQEVTGYWKGWATVARPTFHPRNLIGGVINNMIVNVRFQDYADMGIWGARLKRVLRNPPPDLDSRSINTLEDLMERIGMPERLRPSFQAMIEEGVLLSSFSSSEFAHLTIAARLRKPGGRTVQALRAVNPWDKYSFAPLRGGAIAMETIEDFLRGAAFLRWYDPQRPSTAQLANQMAKLVHFDYADLTALEERIKQFVPFFVWTRRNVPLQLRTLFERPGIAMRYVHIMQAAEEAYGDSDYDPYLSEWMSPYAFVLGGDPPLGDDEYWTRFVFDPDVPLKDVFDLAANPFDPARIIDLFAGQLHPGITTSYQVMFQRDWDDVAAPVGLEQVMRGINLLIPGGMGGSYDSYRGDLMVPRPFRTAFESALPFWQELVAPAFGYNDARRRQSAGLPPRDTAGGLFGLLPTPEVENAAQAYTTRFARGFGFQTTTPANIRSNTFDTQQAIRDIVQRAERRQGIPTP